MLAMRHPLFTVIFVVAFSSSSVGEEPNERLRRGGDSLLDKYDEIIDEEPIGLDEARALIGNLGKSVCGQVVIGSAKRVAESFEYIKTYCEIELLKEEPEKLRIVSKEGYGPLTPMSQINNPEIVEVQVDIRSIKNIINNDGDVSIWCSDHSECATVNNVSKGISGASDPVSFPLLLRPSKAAKFLRALSIVASNGATDGLYCENGDYAWRC